MPAGKAQAIGVAHLVNRWLKLIRTGRYQSRPAITLSLATTDHRGPAFPWVSRHTTWTQVRECVEPLAASWSRFNRAGPRFGSDD